MTNTLMAELEHLRAQVAVLTANQQAAGQQPPSHDPASSGTSNTQALFIPVAKAPPQVPIITRTQSQAPPWEMHQPPIHLPKSRPPDEPIVSSADEFQTVLLALTPDEHPPNLQAHLFRCAKDALLILSSSPRLTTVQQQELRDIVRILNSMGP
jgi:hypothetical protein